MKPGDRVRLVRLTLETFSVAAFVGVVLGQEYRVCSVDAPDGIVVQGMWRRGWFHRSHFELVE